MASFSLQYVEIGLILGNDVSYVHQPQEIVSSKIESDPYAVQTPWLVRDRFERAHLLHKSNNF